MNQHDQTRTDDRNAWPAPMLPMGTPDPDQLDDVTRKMDWLINMARIDLNRRALMAYLEDRLTTIINQITAMPQYRPLAIKFPAGLTTGFMGGVVIHSKQLIDGQTEEGGPIGDTMTLALSLASIANQYRQSAAVFEIIKYVAPKLDHDKISPAIPILNQAGMVLRHPAAMLTDKRMVGQQFCERYQPQINESAPITNWTRDSKFAMSFLSLRADMPATLAAIQTGQPLNRLIELPDGQHDGQANEETSNEHIPISSEARAAYNAMIIDHIEEGQGSITIGLRPARQISCTSGTMALDQVPTTAMEQAYLNLALTAEMV